MAKRSFLGPRPRNAKRSTPHGLITTETPIHPTHLTGAPKSNVLSVGGATSTSTVDLRNTGGGTYGPRLEDVDLPPGTHEGTIDATVSINRVSHTDTYPFVAVVRAEDVPTDWDAIVAAARAAVGTPTLTLREVAWADGSTTWEIEAQLQAHDPIMDYSSVSQPELRLDGRWTPAKSWASRGHPDDPPEFTATWELDERPTADTMSIRFELSRVTLPEGGLGGREGIVGLQNRALEYDDVPLVEVDEEER